MSSKRVTRSLTCRTFWERWAGVKDFMPRVPPGTPLDLDALSWLPGLAASRAVSYLVGPTLRVALLCSTMPAWEVPRCAEPSVEACSLIFASLVPVS